MDLSNCYMDMSKLFYLFLALCQTKPRWSLTKSSKLLEASAQTKRCWLSQSAQCLGLLCLWQCFNLSFLPCNYHIIWLPISTTSFPCISLKIPTFSLLLRASQTVSYSFLSISSSYSFSAFSGSEVKWSEVWLLLKEPLPPGYLVLTRGLHDN